LDPFTISRIPTGWLKAGVTGGSGYREMKKGRQQKMRVGVSIGRQRRLRSANRQDPGRIQKIFPWTADQKPDGEEAQLTKSAQKRDSRAT
jgi:hypothetical protein